MAYCCMKYRLTNEGFIPGFLYTGAEGVGGVFGVKNGGDNALNEDVFIGIGFDDQTGDFEILPTKQDLITYLDAVSFGWKQLKPGVDTVTSPDDLVPFDPVTNATWVWDRLEALQAM